VWRTATPRTQGAGTPIVPCYIEAQAEMTCNSLDGVGSSTRYALLGVKLPSKRKSHALKSCTPGRSVYKVRGDGDARQATEITAGILRASLVENCLTWASGVSFLAAGHCLQIRRVLQVAPIA
jgi:hypothetical protein